ncbi:unnamed protein product [Orchesella dallaii]|uniref:Uncharacterized protein n=1 Tax=Orchesella dallaii TaxID=48710 RepID=A0ABP1PPR0_9HEXA
MVNLKAIISIICCLLIVVTPAHSHNMTDQQIDDYNFVIGALTRKYSPNETFIPLLKSYELPPQPLVPSSPNDSAAAEMANEELQNSSSENDDLNTIPTSESKYANKPKYRSM